jgi:hypothetical protein
MPQYLQDNKRDPVNGNPRCGPVILKVDKGPRHIVASGARISKQADFLGRGLYILMGIPNSTSVKYKMDALHRAFISATYARGEVS